MDLPQDVADLCNLYLEQVRRDPQHELSIEQRTNIYRAFQPSRFDVLHYSKRDFIDDNAVDRFLEDRLRNANVGDRTLSWLFVLTVERALTRWDNVTPADHWEKQYLEQAANILEDSRDLLLDELDFDIAHEKLVSDYWYFTHFFVHYDLACLDEAGIYLLAWIIYGEREYEVVTRAVKAYTVIDKNLPGGVEVENQVAVPLEYNLEKRLEFWEWWLTEGIIHAWELAIEHF